VVEYHLFQQIEAGMIPYGGDLATHSFKVTGQMLLMLAFVVQMVYGTLSAVRITLLRIITITRMLPSVI